MRCLLLGAVGLIGCVPAAGGPQPAAAQSPPPLVTAAPPSSATVAQSAPRPLDRAVPISPEARMRARAAFGQALELWSEGRVAEANGLVDVGLSVLGRRLPEDAVPERLGGWLENTAKSAEAGALAFGDSETLLVADASTGRLLGLRTHDYAGSETEPAVSPRGTLLVAPSGSDLLVYESKGLALRLRIPARKDAPFAFLSDDQLVTVRLGEPSSGLTARGQLLQRNLAMPASDPAAAQRAVTAEDAEFSDDELVIVDLRSGKAQKPIPLSPPPDGGLLRKVASLPPSRHCNESDECQRYELNPTPIGRRVEELKTSVGMIVASWQGGATTIHRIRDGKLIGAFRSRGERWKPGLVALWPKPPRAAVVTSLPNVGRGNEPPFSVTALFDLNAGRLLEILDECRWATGLAFSRDGTRLMVGDLRRACLHDGRSGRFLETTEEVRPAKGPDDDLQDVSVRPVPAGRWLLTTADGTFGLYGESGGRALFRGRSDHAGSIVATDEKSLFVADFSGGEARLLTFGPSGVERRLLRTEEMEQKQIPPELAESPEGRRAAVIEKVLRSSCLVDGFRLPIELCHGVPKLP